MVSRSTRGRSSTGDKRRLAADWLREIFLEDLGLKLVALVIAVGFWLAVTGLRAPATMRLRGVPLEFIRPENMEIGNDPIEQVDVTLEGSQARLSDVNARNLVARADLTQFRQGERVARLTPQTVTMDVPAGVRVVGIEPRTVAVRLEPIVEREVDVEPRFEGDMPEGYIRGATQVTPARVRIRGPESHVASIEKVQTETISLAEQRETFVSQTAINIPDRKISPVEAVASVRIDISEEQIERRFADVPVTSASGGVPQPASVALTVRGARSVVTGLRPQDLRLVLDIGVDGTLRPRLMLPPGLEGRMELVSTSPSEFAINQLNR
jgi:YbbR domain-containing protein